MELSPEVETLANALSGSVAPVSATLEECTSPELLFDALMGCQYRTNSAELCIQNRETRRQAINRLARLLSQHPPHVVLEQAQKFWPDYVGAELLLAWITACPTVTMTQGLYLLKHVSLNRIREGHVETSAAIEALVQKATLPAEVCQLSCYAQNDSAKEMLTARTMELSGGKEPHEFAWLLSQLGGWKLRLAVLKQYLQTRPDLETEEMYALSASAPEPDGIDLLFSSISELLETFPVEGLSRLSKIARTPASAGIVGNLVAQKRNEISTGLMATVTEHISCGRGGDEYVSQLTQGQYVFVDVQEAISVISAGHQLGDGAITALVEAALPLAKTLCDVRGIVLAITSPNQSRRRIEEIERSAVVRGQELLSVEQSAKDVASFVLLLDVPDRISGESCTTASNTCHEQCCSFLQSYLALRKETKTPLSHQEAKALIRSVYFRKRWNADQSSTACSTAWAIFLTGIGTSSWEEALDLATYLHFSPESSPSHEEVAAVLKEKISAHAAPEARTRAAITCVKGVGYYKTKTALIVALLEICDGHYITQEDLYEIFDEYEPLNPTRNTFISTAINGKDAKQAAPFWVSARREDPGFSDINERFVKLLRQQFDSSTSPHPLMTFLRKLPNNQKAKQLAVETFLDCNPDVTFTPEDSKRLREMLWNEELVAQIESRTTAVAM